MFKIKSFILIFLMSIFFIGCVGYFDSGSTEFIVDKVLDRDGMKDYTTYRVTMIDITDLGGITFWFNDLKGKYKVGDRLILIKKEQK